MTKENLPLAHWGVRVCSGIWVTQLVVSFHVDVSPLLQILQEFIGAGIEG